MMPSEDSSLDVQVKSLSSTFKRNLGTFLSRVQQQAVSDNAATDIEGLLTDLDRVISNQKELSELIQKVKLHQKISKELDIVNDNIDGTRNSMIALIDDLTKRDLDFSNRLVKAYELKNTLNALESMIEDPERTVLAAINLACTTSAPTGWNPSKPLVTHKPPYPTEDLIRRSALYGMMTESGIVVDQEASVKGLVDEIPAATETKSVASGRGRRRTTAADKAKLLDLDI